MEDKLKDLKKILTDSITNEKNIHFTQEHKNRVLKTIKSNSLRNNVSRSFHGRIHLLFSVALTCILLAGTYYIAGIDDIFSKNDADQIYQAHEPNKIPPDSSKDIPENTVIVPPVQEENYNDMTKEEIYKKLLSSNKFDTAKGEYEIQTVIHDGTKMNSTVKYSLGFPMGGYSVESYNHGDSVANTITYYKEDTLWTLDSASKTYSERRYRNSVQPPIARSSLFPREITLNYLKNLDNWKIEIQNEKILTHNTIVIKGNLNEYAAEKHSAKTFRFWIDKDTGVLLKYETYNQNGEVVDYLYPKELQINVPIDTKMFTPNLDGYKKSERESAHEESKQNEKQQSTDLNLQKPSFSNQKGYLYVHGITLGDSMDKVIERLGEKYSVDEEDGSGADVILDYNGLARFYIKDQKVNWILLMKVDKKYFNNLFDGYEGSKFTSLINGADSDRYFYSKETNQILKATTNVPNRDLYLYLTYPGPEILENPDFQKMEQSLE
ncbi:sigma-E factor regulatory protein RseB domain-containing protein [Bacillus sp. JJ1533]|uniref:sigma-E factor regulatory protein RseB domain-containing protein n=1 Tax=Bacillus sp. JJ1533 TaxID=3122959 RepID=UPI002FFDB24E